MQKVKKKNLKTLKKELKTPFFKKAEMMKKENQLLPFLPLYVTSTNRHFKSHNSV